MSQEMQRQIASKGGKAAHAKGRAHEWTVDEARAAGRKGGAASHRPAPPPRQTGSDQAPDQALDDNVFAHTSPADV